MGEDSCNGAQCLIAWEQACKAKDTGGLGIKRIEDHNKCLLMKFTSRLHDSITLPWKHWVNSQYSDILFTRSADSYIAKMVSRSLNHFRQ